MLKEEFILDKAIDIYTSVGGRDAYQFLIDNYSTAPSPSSQYYNFLYCLAASTGKTEEAINWLSVAIEDKGYWYRSDVFDDADLDAIRQVTEFERLKKISDNRYESELTRSTTKCTFEEVKKSKLALVLHGNQQNIDSDHGYWKHLELDGYQVEYVQSKTIDSVNLYRWDDSDDLQLGETLDQLPLTKYEEVALCGFSAGCNEILRAVTTTTYKPARLIFVAPWLPSLDKDQSLVKQALTGVRINIVCGALDEDCLPHSKQLTDMTTATLTIIPNLGHTYPMQLLTDRLFLRSFTPSELPDYEKIMIDSLVTKYLGDGSGLTSEEIEPLMTRWIETFNNGTPVFAVIEKESKSLIGHCGLASLPDGKIELLYALKPSAWGTGYGKEAANAVIGMTKERLPIDELVALTYPENTGSQKILKRLNFKHVDQKEYFGKILDVYSLKLS